MPHSRDACDGARRVPLPLVVDDLCQHVDTLAAACCAAALARHLRSEAGCTTRALLASSHASIAGGCSQIS